MNWRKITLCIISALCAYQLCTYDLTKDMPVEVKGKQFAKEIRKQSQVEKYYLLIDSEYGFLDLEVPYKEFLASSNNYLTYKIKYRKLKDSLEDTYKLHRAYPWMNIKLVWISLIIVTLLCVRSILGEIEDLIIPMSAVLGAGLAFFTFVFINL